MLLDIFRFAAVCQPLHQVRNRLGFISFLFDPQSMSISMSAPSLHTHYRYFITTTNRSTPPWRQPFGTNGESVHRIGTFPLVRIAACGPFNRDRSRPNGRLRFLENAIGMTLYHSRIRRFETGPCRQIPKDHAIACTPSSDA